MKEIEWETLEACPVCESDQLQNFLVSIVSVDRPVVKWVMCNECSSLFANPRPTEAYLTDFYKEDYRELVHRNKKKDKDAPPPSVRDEAIRSIHTVHQLKRYVGYERKNLSHLDVGSSTGALLAGTLGTMDISYSVGVEPNNMTREFSDGAYKKYASSKSELKEGHKWLTVTDISEVSRSPKFDIVTIIHTLEHTRDPLGLLMDVKSRIKTKGVLIVTTPALAQGMSDPLMFPHLFCFTRETITSLLERVGFTVTLFETGSTSAPQWTAPHDMTVIAELNPAPMDKSRLLELYANNMILTKEIVNAARNQMPRYEIS